MRGTRVTVGLVDIPKNPKVYLGPADGSASLRKRLEALRSERTENVSYLSKQQAECGHGTMGLRYFHAFGREEVIAKCADCGYATRAGLMSPKVTLTGMPEVKEPYLAPRLGRLARAWIGDFITLAEEPVRFYRAPEGVASIVFFEKRTYGDASQEGRMISLRWAAGLVFPDFAALEKAWIDRATISSRMTRSQEAREALAKALQPR